MERKRQAVDNDGKIRFKKLGGGSLRFGGRIIKPNEVFRAYPDDIPKGFRDIVVPLDKVPLSKEEEPIDVVKVDYELRARGAGGWYDIFNKITDKKVNDRALKRDAAEKLLTELEGK